MQRYDPRQTDGLSDAAVYYRLAAGEPVDARELRFRILVPYIARAIHQVTRVFFAPPRSVYIALLFANSIFCATSACIIVAIGLRLFGNIAEALLAATLYLLNFAVMNLFLPAMIDAGEACLLLVLTFALMMRRWWWLPVCGVVGTLAKETYLPLAGLFTIVWWIAAERRAPDRMQKLLPIFVMIGTMVVTIFAVRSILATSGETSAILAMTHASGTTGRLAIVSSPTVWYVFIWLLPLGIPRLARLPRPWVFASFSTAIFVLVLGIYRDIGGNIARPLFTVLGPLLSVSAAQWLSHPAGPPPVGNVAEPET